MHATRHKCPHCGNTRQELIQDNGLRSSHPDLTLLCVAPADSASSTYDEPVDGEWVCGMQWEPNGADWEDNGDSWEENSLERPRLGLLSSLPHDA